MARLDAFGQQQKRRQRPAPAPPAAPAAGPDTSDLELASPVAASRVRIAALDQSLQAAETACGIADAAALAMGQMSAWLEELGMLARRAADQTHAPETADVEARQRAWSQALEQLSRLVREARFGEHLLLNGSLGCTGAAVGAGLQFVAASDAARSSPPEGYAVAVEALPRRAELVGQQPLTDSVAALGVRLSVYAGERQATVQGKPGQSAAALVRALAEALARHDLPVALRQLPDGRLRLRHRKAGATNGFTASSSVPGVLSELDGSDRVATGGQDIAGAIQGEPAAGQGALLTGAPLNSMTAGLVVRFDPPAGMPPPRRGQPVQVGRVIVVQRALTVPLPGIGVAPVVLRVDNLSPQRLGRGVPNESGFGCLAEADLVTPQAAADAQKVLMRALEELTRARERLAALRNGPLRQALLQFQQAVQELGVLRTDTDDPAGAMALAHRVSRSLGGAAREALTAQQPPLSGTAMRLISGETEPSTVKVWS
jgi:hypothetical protein